MTDNRKIALECCHVWQERDDFWEEFEYLNDSDIHWQSCSEEIHPLIALFSHRAWGLMCPSGWEFRRKPKTITVTMPVPSESIRETSALGPYLLMNFDTEADRDTALAVIREAMKDE